MIPFLSQDHQQQVASAVERAKQVTMAELNQIIGVSSLGESVGVIEGGAVQRGSMRVSSLENYSQIMGAKFIGVRAL